MLEKTDEQHPFTATSDADTGTIAALARYRQNVLRQASTLFGGQAGIPFVENFDALPNVSSLLLTSLEELKVAEEELRAQNNELMQQRGAVEARMQRYHDLFQCAPAPAFVTDLLGTIQEANAAALALFRREAKHLEHKPIQALIPPAAREAFRRQLSRLQTERGVADWHISFQRTGDLPVAVSAAVGFVPRIGRTGAGALYWLLHVLD